jgi:hypothetical protein
MTDRKARCRNTLSAISIIYQLNLMIIIGNFGIMLVFKQKSKSNHNLKVRKRKKTKLWPPTLLFTVK